MSIIFSGVDKRIERERQMWEIQAWQTARLVMIGYHRPRKFPEFNKIASVKVRRPRQTVDQMKAIAKMMTITAGGTVTVRNG
ncbi:MAG TPA: hypothetical protein DIT40_05960 [Alphaproteobacteria bacterium]|nr:hypothetical protein [Alphaproteobacteria bacterium]